MPVDGAARPVAAFFGGQVGDDLMAVEVEIDPLRSASAFRTAQKLPVESAGLRDVADGKSKMERNACRGVCHGVVVVWKFDMTQTLENNTHNRKRYIFLLTTN
ncbi:hypothetical protein AVHY2522_07935 [Acidovorax sp. SUPP2522]|nr:hypothetical protein AVHY2522_07935 [Acidovorax sp. SUPP2522]